MPFHFSPYAPNVWRVGTPGLINDPNVFPQLPGQFFYSKKSPIWSTLVAESASGFERRAQLQTYPRWAFEFPYNFIRDDDFFPELDQLFGFYNLHAGRLSTFSLFDPADNTVASQLVAIGDGSTTTFQLTRTINGWTEPVFSLVTRPQVLVAGVAASFTQGTYGQVTFASPPAAGIPITWSGQFMFLCRFDQDQVEVQRDFATILSLKSLAIKSIKPKRSS